MLAAPQHLNAPVPVRVNLYSDTQTKPSQAMRAAMMNAEVGDEQSGTDPTVNALCARMAALFGKEAAMFLPSGTMCNEIAILTHCRPGDEVLAHETAHILGSEGGAPGALAGVQVSGLRGPGGQFDADSVNAAIRSASRYSPRQTLLAVEQTANLGGGTVWPLDRLNEVAVFAHAHGMATLMDGARLMNAAVASGVPALTMAEHYDFVWLDFTKGLGAPLGAVLAGSATFIDEAWRWKQRLGGALRQAGICAAGCLYALDHNVERLAEDHAHAAFLAKALATLRGLKVAAPETNLVFIHPTGDLSADDLTLRLAQHGVLVSVLDGRLRACTHLDVSLEDVNVTIEAFNSVLGF